MDLSQVSTEDLRAELSARKKREDAAVQEAFRIAHPCPECGGDPRKFEQKVVEEFRFAPRDGNGRPLLYAPYEMGTTNGVRWEDTVTCENGHVTATHEIQWYDKPR